MRSLVTGGAGFIGSHVVDALVARGDEVLVLDDFSTGKRENIAAAVDQGAVARELDITDSAAVFEAVGEFAPQRVFHLAAQIDVRKSMADPGFDVRLNVLGTVNVLEAAARAGAERLVFTSSGGTVYGEGQGREDELPFSEDAPNSPDSIYGQSKLAAEGYVRMYDRSRGLPSATLRLGNVYGPRQDPATEAGVVAIFAEQARDGRRPDVFGTGEQTRDYIHVEDVVAAILAADASDRPGPFNVGTGVETTVLELVELIASATGRDDFEPEFEPARAGEVERNVLDPERAAGELGWRAERTISAGIEETLDPGDG